MLSMVLLALGVPVWLFMRPVVVPIVLTAIAVTLYLLVFNFFRCPHRVYRGEQIGRAHV